MAFSLIFLFFYKCTAFIHTQRLVSGKDDQSSKKKKKMKRIERFIFMFCSDSFCYNPEIKFKLLFMFLLLFLFIIQSMYLS